MNIAKLTEKQCSQCWAMGYCDSCAADMGEDNKLDAKKIGALFSNTIYGR